MDSLPVSGEYSITVPQKGMKDKKSKTKNHSARTAKLTIKASAITIKSMGKELQLNAVYAQEHKAY